MKKTYNKVKKQVQKEFFLKMQSSDIFDKSRIFHKKKEDQMLTDLQRKVNKLAASVYSEQESYSQIDKNVIQSHYSKQCALLKSLINNIQGLKMEIYQQFIVQQKMVQRRNNTENVCEQNIAFLKKLLREAQLIDDEDQYQCFGVQKLLDNARKKYFVSRSSGKIDNASSMIGQCKLKSSIERQLLHIKNEYLQEQFSKIPKVLSLGSNLIQKQQQLQKPLAISKAKKQISRIYLTPPIKNHQKYQIHSSKVQTDNMKSSRKNYGKLFNQNQRKLRIEKNPELYLKHNKQQLDSNCGRLDSLYKRLKTEDKQSELNFSLSNSNKSHILKYEDFSKKKCQIQQSLVLESLIQDRMSTINRSTSKEQQNQRLRILQEMVNTNNQLNNTKQIDKKQLQFSQILCEMMKKYISIMEKPINKSTKIKDIDTQKQVFQKTAQWNYESITQNKQIQSNNLNYNFNFDNEHIQLPFQSKINKNKQDNYLKARNKQQQDKNQNTRYQKQQVSKDIRNVGLQFRSNSPKKTNKLKKYRIIPQNNENPQKHINSIKLVSKNIKQIQVQTNDEILKIIFVNTDSLLVQSLNKMPELISFNLIEPKNVINLDWEHNLIHIKLMKTHKILKSSNRAKMHQCINNLKLYYHRCKTNINHQSNTFHYQQFY